MLRTSLKTVPADIQLETVKRYTQTYCYCLENLETENPHIHWYIEMLTKPPTFRAALKKIGLQGNGGLSLKETTPEPIEYLAYMSKQGKVDWGNLDPDLIEQAREHDKKVKQQIAEKKANKRKVWEVIAQDYVNPDYMYNGKPDEMHLRTAILKYHKDNGILVRRFQLQAIRDTIILYFSTDDDLPLDLFP